MTQRPSVAIATTADHEEIFLIRRSWGSLNAADWDKFVFAHSRRIDRLLRSTSNLKSKNNTREISRPIGLMAGAQHLAAAMSFTFT